MATEDETTTNSVSTTGHSRRQFKKGEWKGRPTLQCPYCSFDSAAENREDVLNAHVQGNHPDKWLEA